MCDIFKINNFRKELLSNSMIMDLPEGKFFMKSMAQIEGGMLEIKKLERFEDLMYLCCAAGSRQRAACFSYTAQLSAPGSACSLSVQENPASDTFCTVAITSQASW